MEPQPAWYLYSGRQFWRHISRADPPSELFAVPPGNTVIDESGPFTLEFLISQ